VHRYKEALTESNLQLGEALQTQGQLDQAFTKYRHCVITKEVLSTLYSLGEDYERKRQFNKAAEVFRYINVRRRRYRDVEKRIQKNEQLANVIVLGNNKRSTSTQTLILSTDGIQKPVLGRYQIEKELGRGAMGMVYLGRDPKIGRTVAIKTMSFMDEFDEDEIEDVKQRFQREANTAGRLKHPNIVTIYDIGEEQDLSYIAMDYLEGKNLASFIKDDKLLAPEKVLDIAEQVAKALHYAHEQNVVHRDIKPENIIYNEKTGKPTLTDFGVACLTNASTTKTGVVLGSPSYMSPEQLAGKKIDGRSDLFSLGVALFQMLCGKLPFTADTLSALMYKIANDRHPDIRKIRGELKPCISTLLNRVLQKDPNKRFQTGNQMAEALQKCREKYNGTGQTQKI
jgi:serine/threonine-protein kinase